MKSFRRRLIKSVFGFLGGGREANKMQASLDTYQSLDVETLGGHDVVDFLLGHGLEDSGFARVVQAEHQDSCFFLALFQTAQQIKKTHFFS